MKKTNILGSKLVLRDFYVDDLMSGANTVQNALKAQNEIRQMLQTGGMPIRKWTSNCEKILLNKPEKDREISLPLQLDVENTVKTLGISWNPATDEFKYKVVLSEGPTTTKRKLVSEIAKIFDPIGWLSPVVLRQKFYTKNYGLWV